MVIYNIKSPKHFVTFSLILFSFFIYSCSSDDENSNSQRLNDVITVNERNFEFQGDIYLTKITDNGNMVTTENLVESIGLENDISRVNLNSEYLTFYKGFNPVTINHINFKTDRKEEFVIPCGSSVLFRDNNKDMFYAVSLIFEQGSYFYTFYTYDFNERQCQTIILGEDLSNFSGFIDSNNAYLGFNIENSRENYKLVKIDLDSSEIVNELEFNSNINATVKDNQLLVFNNFEERLEIYDKETFDLIEFRNQTYPIFESDNLFTTLFNENKMLSYTFYPQPGPVRGGPIVIDLETSEITDGISNNFMFDILLEISQTSNLPYYLTGSYAVDLENNVIVLGFGRNLDSTSKGAIVYTNFEGELLKTVELDYVPNYITFN